MSNEEERELGERNFDYLRSEGFGEGREYEREHPVYSHRNGETADPEVDGYYWVEYLGVWTIEFSPCQSKDREFTLSHFHGPIPMPEKIS